MGHSKAVLGTYQVTQGTRTTSAGTRNGWVVEIIEIRGTRAASILFDTEAEAIDEARRLQRLDGRLGRIG